MKKNLYLILSLALAACLMLSACGNSASANPSSDETSVVEPVSVADDESADEPASEDGAEEAGGTIAEYAEQMQVMMDEFSGMFGDALTIGIAPEGDSTLIVTYTMLDDSLGLTADNIDEYMESQEATMPQLVERMKSGGIDSAIVVIKWIDTDGTEIFSKEYK